MNEELLDHQEAGDILEAQKESKHFDPRWDLSDDPMDQAKMAGLRRDDLEQWRMS